MLLSLFIVSLSLFIVSLSLWSPNIVVIVYNIVTRVILRCMSIGYCLGIELKDQDTKLENLLRGLCKDRAVGFQSTPHNSRIDGIYLSRG